MCAGASRGASPNPNRRVILAPMKETEGGGPAIETHSTITCPICGHRATEEMPADACLRVYECEGCGAVLRPEADDCCVFCTSGDIPCPPIQKERERG